MNKEEIIDGAMYRLHATPEHILDTWCKHNLLIARIYDDGNIRFKDTYWMSGEWVYVFEDMCDRMSFVFDMNHAKEVTKREWQEYDDRDKTWIPIGGISEQWIVDDRAEKSKHMIISTLEHEIDKLVSDIQMAQHNLGFKKELLKKLLDEE